MANKHRIAGNICAWCKREFASPNDLRQHERAKHLHNMPRTEEAEVEAKLQRYHQDKVSKKQHSSDCALHNAPAYPPGPCDCGAA